MASNSWSKLLTIVYMGIGMGIFCFTSIVLAQDKMIMYEKFFEGFLLKWFLQIHL